VIYIMITYTTEIYLLRARVLRVQLDIVNLIPTEMDDVK